MVVSSDTYAIQRPSGEKVAWDSLNSDSSNQSKSASVAGPSRAESSSRGSAQISELEPPTRRVPLPIRTLPSGEIDVGNPSS